MRKSYVPSLAIEFFLKLINYYSPHSDADRKKKRKRDDKRGSIDPDIEMLDGTCKRFLFTLLIDTASQRSQ